MKIALQERRKSQLPMDIKSASDLENPNYFDDAKRAERELDDLLQLEESMYKQRSTLGSSY